MNNISLIHSTNNEKNKKKNKKKQKKPHTFVNKCVCHFCCVAHIIAQVKEKEVFKVHCI